jgi:hypothetical protein
MLLAFAPILGSVYWQAHRDLRSAGATENTIEAFRCARLARLTGRAEKVADLSLAEMKALAKAPSLSELLSDSEAPRFINIEIKTNAVWVGRGLEEAVIQAIRGTGSEGRRMMAAIFSRSSRAARRCGLYRRSMVS